jgi:hypothetical protein
VHAVANSLPMEIRAISSDLCPYEQADKDFELAQHF